MKRATPRDSVEMRRALAAARATGRKLLRWVVVLCLAGIAMPSGGALLWVSDDTELRRTDTTSGETVSRITAPGVRQLAGARSGGVWALRGKDLVFAGGNDEAAVWMDIAALGYGEGLHASVDPFDDSCWVVTSQRLLAHFDKAGRLLGGYTLPGWASTAGVALDQSLWVAGERELWRFSPAGTRAQTLTIASPWTQAIDSIHVDSLRSTMWLIGQSAVAIVATDQPSPLRLANVDNRILDSALDTRTGRLWLLTDAGLGVIDAATTRVINIVESSPHDLGDARAIAYDAATDNLWVGLPHAIAIFDGAGRRAGDVKLTGDGLRLAGSPFNLLPRLSLVRPPENASTLDNRPTIDLRLEALCNGRQCEVPADYLGNARLSADLNNRAISSVPRHDSAHGLVSFIEAGPFNPGENRFSAQVVDRFGHAGDRIETTWTLIDTSSARPTEKAPNQRPTIALTSPPNGARYVPGSDITLTATASDADGSVAKVDFYREGTTLLGSDTTNPYSVLWNNVPAGTYSFTAKATDNKGASTTSTSVAVIVAPPTNNPPTIVINGPSEGSTLSASTGFTMTVSAADSDGVIGRIDFYDGAGLLGSVPGGAATLNASWPFNGVSPGTHILKAVATDGAGASASASVTIHVSAAPLVVLTRPAACVYLQEPADITLQADAVAPDGAIASVAFFQGSALIGVATTEPFAVAWSAVPAGTYAVTAKAIDDRGGSTVSTGITVIVAPANNPPTVALTAPAEGATYAPGGSVTLTAAASDPDGSIAKVEFFRDGSLLGAVTAAPYTLVWNAVAPASYSLTARATDNLGASTLSVAVHVHVTNAPPTVALTAPAGGASYAAPATINLAATASDTDGTIANVQFFAGLTAIGTVASAPYTATWSNVAAGTYQLTARATDSYGAVASSAPVTVTVSTNAPPSVALSMPTNGATYFAPATVNLQASASDSDGYIATVEFYRGSTLIGSATSPPYATTWNNAPAGSYALTAKATDGMGATATSVPVNITINANGGPDVVLASPTSGSTYFAPATITLSAAASDSDGIARVDFYQGATLVGTTLAAPYAFVWDNVAAGGYSLTAVATDRLGATAASAPILVNVLGEISITITPGTDGSSVDDDVMLFSGTVSAPVNSGVTVNGRLAQIDPDGAFHVNALPLTPGQNTISVVAIAQDGQTATRNVSVTSAGLAPFAVTATPTEGLAPLSVTFTIVNRGGVPFQSVELDFDSDGTTDYVILAGAFLEGSYELVLTYPAGRWTTKARVRNQNGDIVFSSTTLVTVLAPLELEAKVRSVFTGMLDRLRAGNIAGALTAVTDTVYEKYNAIFNTLQGDFGTIVDQLGSLAEATFGNDVVEYTLVRDTPSGPQQFMIYLIRGADGIWRIEGM